MKSIKGSKEMRLFIKQALSSVGIVGISLLSVSVAFAQDVQNSAETLSQAARETSVPGGALMLIAYIALWLMVFGYLAMIMRRQRALSRDLVALERRMDEVFETEDK